MLLRIPETVRVFREHCCGRFPQRIRYESVNIRVYPAMNGADHLVLRVVAEAIQSTANAALQQKGMPKAPRRFPGCFV